MGSEECVSLFAARYDWQHKKYYGIRRFAIVEINTATAICARLRIRFKLAGGGFQTLVTRTFGHPSPTFYSPALATFSSGRTLRPPATPS